MLQALRRRLERDEEGFTLIELMVVVLIIAILLAIAIPTFLGARARAQHRSTQSNLRNALTAEKTSYTDTNIYTVDAAVALPAIEPSLSWQVVAPAKGTNQVEVVLGANADKQTICMMAVAADGNTYVIADRSTGATPGTYYSNVAVANAAACDALIIPGNSTPSGGGW